MLEFKRGAAGDAKVEDAGTLIVRCKGEFFRARISSEFGAHDCRPSGEHFAVGKSIAAHRLGQHAIDKAPQGLGAIGPSFDSGALVLHVGIEDRL